MRARLWPSADRDELARETRAFVAGNGGTMLAAVFLAEDDRATPLGFIELGVRAFSDGCPFPTSRAGSSRRSRAGAASDGSS